jgi:serine/threonine protein kinase
VRYIDVFVHQTPAKELNICTVMEYCEGGDLNQRLVTLRQTNMALNEDTIVRWMYQLALGLAYMHTKKVLHRDMKPANCFISPSTTGEVLKIGDFGLSVTLEGGKKRSRVGTPSYLAPEVLQMDAYGDGVDVWGLGCIALEMMTMQPLSERGGMLGLEVHARSPITGSAQAPSPPNTTEAGRAYPAGASSCRTARRGVAERIAAGR